MVKPGVKCPSRSLTILIGTPVLRSSAACVCRRSWKRMRGSPDRCTSFWNRPRAVVDVSAVRRSGEDASGRVVAIEGGVLAVALLSPGVQDVEHARVEVDRPASGPGLASSFMERMADRHERRVSWLAERGSIETRANCSASSMCQQLRRLRTQLNGSSTVRPRRRARAFGRVGARSSGRHFRCCATSR